MLDPNANATDLLDEDLEKGPNSEPSAEALLPASNITYPRPLARVSARMRAAKALLLFHARFLRCFAALLHCDASAATGARRRSATGIKGASLGARSGRQDTKFAWARTTSRLVEMTSGRAYRDAWRRRAGVG